MSFRMLAAVLAGLAAGGGAIRHAAYSFGNGGLSGSELLVISAMWAIGIATTAFGAGGIAFYGLGLAELWWRDRPCRKETVDPR